MTTKSEKPKQMAICPSWPRSRKNGALFCAETGGGVPTCCLAIQETQSRCFGRWNCSRAREQACDREGGSAVKREGRNDCCPSYRLSAARGCIYIPGWGWLGWLGGSMTDWSRDSHAFTWLNDREERVGRMGVGARGGWAERVNRKLSDCRPGSASVT